MRHPHPLSIAVALAALITVAGCDAQTVPCEGDDANCACSADEDCVLTQYAAPVTSAGDCYDLTYCCPVDLAPVAADAAQTNEAGWNDQGCVDAFDATSCPECEPGDTAWAECRQGRCAKTYQLIGSPQAEY